MKRCPFLLFLLLLVLFAPLSAHPHMRLTSSFEFVWEDTALTGVWLEWVFDPYFSADIIRAHDRDGNGRFDEAENKSVYEYAFRYIGEYHYFTFIRVGAARHNPTAVSAFRASIDGAHLVYRFFVDLSPYAADEIAVAVYDYTFFCDIPYREKDPVVLRLDPERVEASFVIEENKKYPIYYNPYGAVDDSTVYYTWKKGLMTFYPREVLIRHAAKPSS